MPNDLYDALKWLALIGLPALSTAYSALAGIWRLPFAEQIPSTVSVMSLFLGTVLGVSSINYNQTTARNGAETEGSNGDTGQTVDQVQL